MGVSMGRIKSRLFSNKVLWGIFWHKKSRRWIEKNVMRSLIYFTHYLALLMWLIQEDEMRFICIVLEPFEIYYEIWQVSELRIFVYVTEERSATCASGTGLPNLGVWDHRTDKSIPSAVDVKNARCFTCTFFIYFFKALFLSPGTNIHYTCGAQYDKKWAVQNSLHILNVELPLHRVGLHDIVKSVCKTIMTVLLPKLRSIISHLPFFQILQCLPTEWLNIDQLNELINLLGDETYQLVRSLASAYLTDRQTGPQLASLTSCWVRTEWLLPDSRRNLSNYHIKTKAVYCVW
jgi:hypothetical protein